MAEKTMPELSGAPGLEGFKFSSDAVEGSIPTHLEGAGGLSMPTDHTAASEAPYEASFAGGLGDLSGMLQEGVQDLSWLSDFKPDPSRLPKTVPVIPQLEEAWKHASVQTIEPNRVVHQAPRQTTALALSPADNFRQAVRMATSGKPLEVLLRKIGTVPGAVREAFTSDYGLLGNVFIRAAAYPKCHTGKWSDTVRKTASSAQYVVACDNCAGCVHAQGGNCAIFKKELVAEVPWRQAHAHYAPRLAGTGHRVATGDLRLSLRAAFLAGPTQNKPAPSHTAVQDPARRLAPIAAPVAVQSKEARLRIAQWHAVQKRVADLTRQGFITEDDANRLALSTEAPAKVLAAARALANEPTKAGKYAGHQSARIMPKRDVWASLNMDAADGQQKAKFAQAIKRLVATGQLSSEDAEGLLARAGTVKELTKAASVLVHRRMHEARVAPETATQAAVYSGGGVGAQPGKVAAIKPVATVVPRQRAPVIAAKPAPVYEGQGVGADQSRLAMPKAAPTIQGQDHQVALWTAQQMSKGKMGKALTTTIERKWSKAVVKQAR